MNLFRSEEHIARWLGGKQIGRAGKAGTAFSRQRKRCLSRPGATITVTKLSELAHAWWDDRISPDWRPHTRDQNQAILERLGLTGTFWTLA